MTAPTISPFFASPSLERAVETMKNASRIIPQLHPAAIAQAPAMVAAIAPLREREPMRRAANATAAATSAPRIALESRSFSCDDPWLCLVGAE